VIKIAHQRRTGLAARHMARRAAHVDIDNFGSRRFGDAGAFRHPPDLAARELNHMRAYSRCFASQPRHRAAIDEIIAGGHFRNHKSGPKFGGQASKRGVRDAGHGRKKNPVGEFNIAYLQWLKG
jgi:hypothetical protein